MKREASSGLTDVKEGGMMDVSSAPHAADAERRVIYEPVSIEPREIIPRIIREDKYGGLH